MLRIISHIGLLSAFILSSNFSVAFYDAFPSSDGPYTSGPASDALNWPGENFESYADGNLLECSSNIQSLPHLDVTS